MDVFTREDVERTYSRWRAAVDIRDINTMVSMFTESAKAGNSVYGIVQGETAIRTFLERLPEIVPNRTVWHVIDGSRVVEKWRETLPGHRDDGSTYDYYGIAELIYSEEGKWSCLYSIPDIIGLQTVYREWHGDGHHETYGEIYPMLIKR